MAEATLAFITLITILTINGSIVALSSQGHGLVGSPGLILRLRDPAILGDRRPLSACFFDVP